MLGANNQKLKEDLLTTGFLFESAVVHDLRIMVEALGGKIYHYRDSNGHEIDAVLTFPDGRWAAVEIKLGAKAALNAQDSLKKAVAQIKAAQPPAFLAIISGNGPTLALGENTITFPLSSLGWHGK
ncbi:DUF4143 domain-containing protein [Corynebacterium sp. sy017]|uniref:DUF4143 domain-containing protein n=1 Tax=unclassified Corynebacterium TaxID=2624378 RepID=UPI001185639D|nr:DUF4143 domain-containing protein [Corynebacterium sp. SY003]MBP3088278.1 DUF4143 domain-containing protein [Corynebacterium sp. sy017]TSD91603.1 DUF4143 domain-containing protein [Corynebacterium sp. SY003]